MSKVIYLPIKSTEFTKSLLRKRTPFERFCFSQDMKIPYVRLFSPLKCQFCFWRLWTGKENKEIKCNFTAGLFPKCCASKVILPQSTCIASTMGTKSRLCDLQNWRKQSGHTQHRSCVLSFLCLAECHPAVSFQQMLTKTRHCFQYLCSLSRRSPSRCSTHFTHLQLPKWGDRCERWRIHRGGHTTNQHQAQIEGNLENVYSRDPGGCHT